MGALNGVPADALLEGSAETIWRAEKRKKVVGYSPLAKKVVAAYDCLTAADGKWQVEQESPQYDK